MGRKRTAKKRSTRKAPARKKRSMPREERPPKEVTRDLFLVWRAPRLGRRNPENLTNPVWSWLARTARAADDENAGLSAYQANARFDGPSSFEVGPGWCAARFGQSRTALPDGRTIAIGGEHEDYYDPDFFIYNDVIVAHPSGDLSIYGYPTDVFAPTDFHTATLVGDRIVLIGALGYVRQRLTGTTPTYVLDTTSYAIARCTTEGEAPGWIWKHRATLTGDAIVVAGGQREVLVGDEATTIENADDWSLDLEQWRWTRLTERRWQEWSLRRADKNRNTLFDIESLRFWQDMARTSADRRAVAKKVRERGGLPDFALYDARYTPPVDHEPIPTPAEYPTVASHFADGVTVRYVEDSREVRIVIEGSLAKATVDAIVEDARSKLERLEQTAYLRQRLQ